MNKSATPKRTTSKEWIVRLLFAAALLLLIWICAWPRMSPAAMPATAPETRFSAERAMNDLRAVASEPHGAGSAAQLLVRDYILAQASEHGLQAEVQKSGQIENIIVRLPGTGSTGNVLITGHYDSHPPAPGAGDDGISAAAMLETMRILSVGPELKNDVVFLFTDGEELGYLGSKAFIREHPEAKEEVGVLLCFDARPGNAPLTQRETSDGDGWLMREMARSRPAMFAYSYNNLEERREIDTDCSVFIHAGYLGVEIENDANGTRYHTPEDTVDAISPRLVQAFGTSMERTARHFGSLDLAEAQPTKDTAFYTFPIIGIVTYPTWLTPVSAILAILAFVILVVIAVRDKRLSLGRSLLGTLAFLAVAVIITLLVNVIWNALLDTHPVSREATLGYLDFSGSNWWMIGIMIVVLLLGIACLYGLSRFINVISLTAAGILAFLLMLWLAYFLMDSDNPATTSHIAGPLLGGVAGLAILLFARRRAWIPVWLFLAAIPIFVMIIPTLGILMLPTSPAWTPVLVMLLTLGLLVPQVTFVLGARQ